MTAMVHFPLPKKISNHEPQVAWCQDELIGTAGSLGLATTSEQTEDVTYVVAFIQCKSVRL